MRAAQVVPRPAFTPRWQLEELKQNEKLAVAAYRDFQDGVLPAGPGARSLIENFHYIDAELAGLKASQPTVVATDRHIELLLQKRAATLHSSQPTTAGSPIRPRRSA